MFVNTIEGRFRRVTEEIKRSGREKPSESFAESMEAVLGRDAVEVANFDRDNQKKNQSSKNADTAHNPEEPVQESIIDVKV